MSAPMDEEPTTPDELVDGADGTPEGEPVAQAAPDAAADQSAAPDATVLSQAEYTRSQQAFSTLKAQLGLPRNASREEVLAAVNELQAGPQGEFDDEPEAEPDPRLEAALNRAYEAEYRTIGAIYGDEQAREGVELVNILRETDDLNEIFTNLWTYAQKWGAPAAAAAAATGGGEPAEPGADPNAVPPPIGAGEPGGGASDRQPISQSAARRESGTVQAVRGLFAAAGIASRPVEGQPPR